MDGRADLVGPDMTVIGIIGAGHIGSTVARLAAAAGHEVVISNSRGPETLTDLVADIGPKVRAATAADAASAGDVVVVTIPLKNYRQVPAGPLVGKVVIDTDNYYPQRDGHIAELDSEATTTSELLQRHLRESRVVKAFNNIGAAHLGALARPSGSEDRTSLPIAGDDADAKQTAGQLLDSLGYDAYDVGGLAEGWRFQRDEPAYVSPYGERGGAARPVGAEQLADLLAQAERYNDR
jgi:predicted dinucleotide-binding enzyme